MGWGVYEDAAGAVHVVPEIDDHIAEGHELSWDCPCRPLAARGGPLDPPVASHNQPDWPGSSRRTPVQ